MDRNDSYENVTATVLGKRLGLSPVKVNQILREAGWIEKKGKDWLTTKSGQLVGGVVTTHSISKNKYVLWPANIVSKQAFQFILNHFSSESISDKSNKSESIKTASNNLSKRKKGNILCLDGHWVKSRGEKLIDDWLYMNEITHSYERRLPIEDNQYSDFYIPSINLYIEYWGLDKNKKYLARKEERISVYKEHGFELLSISNNDIKQIDDVMPKYLYKYGIRVD